MRPCRAAICACSARIRLPFTPCPPPRTTAMLKHPAFPYSCPPPFPPTLSPRQVPPPLIPAPSRNTILPRTMTARAREIKLVLLGDSGVGKSSLVLRFVTQSFRPYSESTIGASFMSKVVELDGQTVKVQIWDTAGQEKYHSLAPMYYRGAAAAVVVYDLTRAESFQTLQRWVSELQEKGPKDMQITIAANKKDLESMRQVDQSEAEAYAESIGAGYVETSAKDDVGVHELFLSLCRKVPAPVPVADAARGGIYLSSQTQGGKGKGACC